MRTYNKLIVMGDSYVTPGLAVTPQESFWGLLAEDIKANEIDHYASPGNSYENIEHLIVCNIEELAKDDALLILGLPVLARYATFEEGSTGNVRNTFNADFKCTNTEVLQSQIAVTNKSLYDGTERDVLDFNYEWAESRVLRSLYALEALLDKHNINYIIVNLSDPFIKNTSVPAMSFLVNYFIDSYHIIFNNTYQSINMLINKPYDFDEYKWQGHHGSTGNRYFYDNSLKPTLLKEGLL